MTTSKILPPACARCGAPEGGDCRGSYASGARGVAVLPTLPPCTRLPVLPPRDPDALVEIQEAVQHSLVAMLHGEDFEVLPERMSHQDASEIASAVTDELRRQVLLRLGPRHEVKVMGENVTAKPCASPEVST